MKTIKVVILNWNGAAVLSRFLPSVVENTPSVVPGGKTHEGETPGGKTHGGAPHRVEIVVADNGSTDGSVELLKRDFPDVRLVLLDRNHGFAGGYNRALAQLRAEDSWAAAENDASGANDASGVHHVSDANEASGAHHASGANVKTGSETDYYVLLNSDVETPPGWLEPLIEMLAANPDVAAAAPKLLAFNDSEPPSFDDKPLSSNSKPTPCPPRCLCESASFEYAGASGGFIDALGYPFCRGRIMGTTECDAGQYDDAREVFWATGACLTCRVDVFHALGGFDESFFAHQEEIDLCWRMQSAGWRVMVEPRSYVYHLGAGTLPPSPQKLYLNYRNNLAMLYKNLPSGRMQLIVGVRLVLNFLSAMVYLLRGERKNFSAVMRAHRDFWSMKREGARAKRRQIQSSRKAKPRGVYRGSIILRYLSGHRTFGNIKTEVGE
ncbi:MAG: glycosyltransferase family 2 protein [Alistipes sp.]|jgi:GT2 family glycosyltransferase|nr:glycosyltransferase family 2 protein [Alistipes sp.]